MKTKLALLASLSLTALPAAADAMPGRAPHSANPILPGYYADPSVVQEDGKTFIYATLDPWGDKTLGCWESSDFKNWTYRVLNWPTKQDCTSKTSKVPLGISNLTEQVAQRLPSVMIFGIKSTNGAKTNPF
jgi:arabinoxylan arabinofuranohydrolase